MANIENPVERLIAFCGRRPKLILVIALLTALWGAYCLKNIRVDALPDLSQTQVILYSEWMGRGPDLIEDQVTYPLVSAMLSAPNVSVVRGFSMFGMSFVYVIFADGTDIYWARSRVLEYLSKIGSKLPEGVTPTIGPDASGVGWILQYALVDPTGKNDLSAIRSFQDWSLRYWLSSVPGVAEVAGIGGFEKQYQIELDPNKLAALNVSLEQVMSAVRDSNQNVGGRTLEISEREYYVQGLGYVTDPREIEDVAVGLGENGVPIRVADIGKVSLGPNIRRGFADLNGQGDTVGGLIVMRQGEDTSRVIAAVKKKIEEVKGSFPEGIELKIVYDRSDLIQEAIRTLRGALAEEILVVCLVILVFLMHVRSMIVAAATLGLSVLASFIPMHYLGIGLNVMSLGGIILAVGDIIDGVVVLIENSHKSLASQDGGSDRKDLILKACREVGPSLFSALLVMAVSFLPIFALEAEEGKLFRPLAFTKTFAMLSAAIVSVTVAPPLIALLVKGRIRREDENPLNRVLTAGYRKALRFCLARARWVFTGLVLLVAWSVFLFFSLGSEFMPMLWEGSLLYMPITPPGISVTAIGDLLSRQGEAIKSVPEVADVFGKSGKYDTSTDPAPISMLEYTITLKPKSLWRESMTEEKLIAELDRAVAVPGLNRAWTRPVRGRIDMLSTGIRTPVGVKIFGKDLKTIERIGSEVESALSRVRGTRSVYAEKIVGGYYVDFAPDRPLLARYGLTVGEVQRVIESAVGGMTISQTIEGRERYTINLRYPRELRDDVEKLARVLVATPTGANVPLGLLGRFMKRSGPPMILDEDGLLAGYVYIDVEGRDIGGYVDDAKEAVARSVSVPEGYFISWTGQYEYLERVREKMRVVLPLTLALVFGLLYMSLKSAKKTWLVMAAVPLSLTGGVILMRALHYNMSVAVWAGVIALIGVAVETASIMVIFLDEAWESSRRESRLRTPEDFDRATMDGAQKCLRPTLMAVAMNVIGLIPVMSASGIGSDVIKRISSPMFGGLVSLTGLTLFAIPLAYRWMNMKMKDETPCRNPHIMD